MQTSKQNLIDILSWIKAINPDDLDKESLLAVIESVINIMDPESEVTDGASSEDAISHLAR